MNRRLFLLRAWRCSHRRCVGSAAPSVSNESATPGKGSDAKTEPEKPGMPRYWSRQKWSSEVELDRRDVAGAILSASGEPAPVESTPTVEKSSVARGLFVNRIDAKAMRFPEFSDVDSLRRMQEYCRMIERFMQTHVNTSGLLSDRKLDSEVMNGLKKLGVFGLSVPGAYGGMGLSNKEYCLALSALSSNLSVLTTVLASDMTCRAILGYGSEQQRQTLLPALASGEALGAFARYEAGKGEDMSNAETTLQHSQHNDSMYLYGRKHWVTNGSTADVFVTFAKAKDHPAYAALQQTPSTALVFDRRTLEEGSVRVENTHEPVGLKNADFADIHFDNLQLTGDAVLGVPGEGYGVAVATQHSGQYAFGAVAATLVQRLCTELAQSAERQTETMENHMTELMAQAYMCESMTYYVAGMLDDDPSRDMSVEGTMITLFARQMLRDAAERTLKCLGTQGLTEGSIVERLTRDMTALSRFGSSDDYLHSFVAVNAMISWAQNSKSRVHEMMQLTDANLATPSKIMRYLWHESKQAVGQEYRHHLHEHLHPTFETTARNIEKAIGRLDIFFEHAAAMYSKSYDKEHLLHRRVSDLGLLAFANLATIVRCSRATALDLPGSDLERQWAEVATYRAQISIDRLLRELDGLDYSFYSFAGSYAFDIARKHVSDGVAALRGYHIESPIAKNW